MIFDNYTNRDRYSPIVRVQNLGGKYSTHTLRHPVVRNIVKGEDIFAFEYTFCFAKEAIWKKLSSFAHVTEMNKDDLDFCFENNISFPF